jgi:hypothetical protein
MDDEFGLVFDSAFRHENSHYHQLGTVQYAGLLDPLAVAVDVASIDGSLNDACELSPASSDSDGE